MAELPDAAPLADLILDLSEPGIREDDGTRRASARAQLVFRLTGEEQPIPKGHRWSDLAAPQMEGARLEDHYRQSLKKLGEQSGMLGLVFRKAQNKIQDPAKLRQLIVELIGKEQWLSMTSDVKGDAYEGLPSR